MACPGLKRLRLKFRAEKCAELDNSERANFFFPASEAILTRLRLDSLFLLGALRQLTICTLGSDYVTSTHSHDDVLRRGDLVASLKIAIEDGFKKAGRQERVEVEYTDDLLEAVMRK